MRLTERDEAIIALVAQLRFATQEQIQLMLFSATTGSSCRRRLTLLFHNGWLDRRLIPLHSSFGANRAVYCLSRRGAELLAFRTKTGAPPAWRPADNDRELYFLEHTVAANDVRVCVSVSAGLLDQTVSWIDERTLRSHVLRDRVTDPTRSGRRLTVIPDGYFVLSGDLGEQAFALELDRGTVEERPFKEKIRALGEWKTSGTYRRRFGTDSLRVLFVVARTRRDAKRLARIKAWTEAEGGRSLFWFAHLDALANENIFTAKVWSVAGRSETYSLIGNHD